MSLKHMLLGVLMEQPHHGYELKSRAFQKIFGEFGVNDGQLYPALKKMEAEGLIDKIVEIQEGAPNRHVYSITEAGRQVFMEWLQGRDEEERAFRYDFFRKDPFFMRCNYFRYLDEASAVSKVNGQIKDVQEYIMDLEAAGEDMRARQVDPVRIKILDYGLKSERTRLEWLEELKELLEKGL